MTPLPAALGGGPELVTWRLDRRAFAASWDSGEGARREGGRWNSVGRGAVYTSLDPSTTILETAVHAGFALLDTFPHVLTSLIIVEPGTVHVVDTADIPNPDWLRPGDPSVAQQGFGDELLSAHPFVVLPSVVSTESWNLIFDSERVAGRYALRSQQPFALDPRLHPARQS